MTGMWFALVLLCFLMYVVLDGYDLGVGTATLFERDAARRRHMVESVAVAWDGNETWLVLLGVALWAGFPLAYGTILPHLYLPLVVVLFALILRGISVELVSHAPASRGWEKVFGVASLVASFGQGFALGKLTEPVRTVDGFAGSTFGGFSWFSVLCGLTVTAAYLALGYGYTRLKFRGRLRASAGRRGLVATAVTVVLTAATIVAINATGAPLHVGTPVRGFAFAGLLLVAAAGIAVAAATFRATTSPADCLPLAGLGGATVSVFLAILVARYPVLLPPRLTLDKAASPANTLAFLLVGVGLNMPLVLFYNLFAHRAFRGKLDAEPSPAGMPSANGASR
jgi:cytochrome bd ubiquinol oxidase subunit II